MSDRLREPPAERFDAPSLVFDFHQEAEAIRAEPVSGANHHGHRQKTLYKHAGRTIALFVMHEGSVIRDHSANGTVSIQPIEGELVVTVEGEDKHLKAGSLLVLASRVRHEVKANTAAVFVLQVSLGA